MSFPSAAPKTLEYNLAVKQSILAAQEKQSLVEFEGLKKLKI